MSAAQPVCRPTIPYIGPIQGGLREKMSITINGVAHKDMTRFFVNLLCGDTENSDVALHINPRFDGWDKVVFNTRREGSWLSEDKIRSMPFTKGEKFELTIQVEPEQYVIQVNGKKFHEYKHRLPVAQVRAMHISGDVAVETINVLGGRFPCGPAGGVGGCFPGGVGPGGFPAGPAGSAGPFYPGSSGPAGIWGGTPSPNQQPLYPGSSGPAGIWGGTPSPSPGPGPSPNQPFQNVSGQPFINPPVPFSTHLASGMFPRRTLVIRGKVNSNATRLNFDLAMSRSHSREIAFHLNPRIKEQVVVRNSHLNGKWDKEERQLAHNPFAAGQQFDLSITNEDNCFRVVVNGQHLCDFAHRVRALPDVDRLDIAGDVQLFYVQI